MNNIRYMMFFKDSINEEEACSQVLSDGLVLSAACDNKEDDISG